MELQLVLDKRAAERELQKISGAKAGAKAGQEFTTGFKKTAAGTEVPVGADATPANTVVEKLKARLKAFAAETHQARLDTDSLPLEAKLARIGVRLTEIGKRVEHPRVDVDGIAKAEAELLGLQAQMAATGKASDGMQSKFFQARSSLGLLSTAAVAFGPAVVPAFAVAGAAVIGFGGILAGSVSALGVFGAAASSHYKQMATDLKKVQAAQAAANKAGASPEVIANAKALSEAFKKDYGELATAQERMQGAWKKFTSQPVVNTILAKGLNLIAAIIPKLQPLFDAGAASANRFLGALQRWTAGGGLDRTVGLLAHLASAVLPPVETTIRNVARAVGAAAPLFFDLGVKVAQMMARTSGALATWAGNRGVDAMNSFMAYLRDNGPRVAATLAALAGAAVAIVRDLSPLAPVSLAIATALAKMIAVMPAPVIQAIAVAFVAYSLAAKAAAVATSLQATAAVFGLGPLAAQATATNVAAGAQARLTIAQRIGAVASTVLAGASRALGVAMTFALGPVGLIIIAVAAAAAAFYLLWTRSTGFRVAIIGTWNAIKTAAGAVVTFFTTTLPAAFGASVRFIAGVFTTVKTAIAGPFTTWWAANGEALKRIWSAVWTAVRAIFIPIWNLVITVLRAGWAVIRVLFTTYTAVLRAVWAAWWQIAQGVAQVAWAIITNTVRMAFGTIRAIFTVALAVLRAAWSVAWATIRAIVTVAWAAIRTIIKISFDIIVGIFTVAINLLTGRWGAAWRAILALGKQIWNAIAAYFRTALGAYAAWWGTVWAGVVSVFRAIWTGLRIWFSAWWGGLRGMIGGAVGGIARILSGAWTGMKNTAVAIFGGMKSAIAAVWEGIKNIVRAPVRWIADNVWNRFAGIVNTFTNFVGLHKPIPVMHLAGGGIVPEVVRGGGDRQPALLERDETVVSRSASRLPFMRAAFAAAGVPGYQAGGTVGNRAPQRSAAEARFGPAATISGGNVITRAISGAAGAVGRVTVGALDSLGGLAKRLVLGTLKATAGPLINTLTGVVGRLPGGGTGWGQVWTALPKKMFGAFLNWLGGQDAAAQATGSGADIAKYAETFVGKLRYVFGGSSFPNSVDCSSFVQGVYKHFGINAPRTSEAQGAWVKRGPPVSGGAAFYHSPPGGADPGHVAIVKNASTVISHGGGMGPNLRPLRYLPLLWTGTPPGGFGGGGTPGHGLVPANAAAMAGDFAAHGFTRNAIAGLLGNIMQESGGNPRAGSNPPGAGLIQILGDPGGTLLQELGRTMAYIAANGSVADINAHASTPTEAAVWFSAKYERPGNPQIQNRIAAANASYAAGYAKGGWINEPVLGVGRYSKALYSFGEAGREYVTPEAQMRGGDGGAAPLIGAYHTNYYGTGDTASAMNEMTFTLRRVRQGAFFR